MAPGSEVGGVSSERSWPSLGSVHSTDSMASGVTPSALAWWVTSGEVSSSAWELATASTRTSASSASSSSPTGCCCCFFSSCWLMWWRMPAPRASPSTLTTVVVRSLHTGEKEGHKVGLRFSTLPLTGQEWHCTAQFWKRLNSSWKTQMQDSPEALKPKITAAHKKASAC